MFDTSPFTVHPDHQTGIFVELCAEIGYAEYALCSQFPSLLIGGGSNSPMFVCPKIEEHYLQIARINHLVRRMSTEKFKFTFRDIKIENDSLGYNLSELNLKNYKVTLDNVLIASINKSLVIGGHLALEAVPYLDGEYEPEYFDIKLEDIIPMERDALRVHRAEFSNKMRKTLRGEI